MDPNSQNTPPNTPSTPPPAPTPPPQPSPQPASQATPESKNTKSQIFLNTDMKKDSANENVFNYMMDGKEFSRAPKEKVNSMELFEKILRWCIIVGGTILVILFLDTQLRMQEDNTNSAFKYSFLCDYFIWGIDEYKNTDCKTVTMVETEITAQKKQLENRIIESLSEYLPIKIQQGSLFALEEAFIDDTMKNKIPFINVMSDFQTAKLSVNSGSTEVVSCNGVQITSKGILNSQCTVYGGNIGETGESDNLGSARIEAMKFVEYLSDPTISHFIITTPPSSLNIKLINDNEREKLGLFGLPFTTSTFVPIQLQYIAPFGNNSGI